MFVSRPALWTSLHCVDLDKTRVYLERSKSSPVDLSLHSYRMSLFDHFFKFLPHIAGRLKSLNIEGRSEHLQAISAHLDCPAPLLEELSICGANDSILPSTFLNGDLSVLHTLYLHDVCTELPWRNMVNLTSFSLLYGSPISTNQYLDLFESAPRLRHVFLCSATPITGAQNERLVPMACLKWMDCSSIPGSLLFDHLLIPVGADLAIQADLPSQTEGRPPKFIDNLKNPLNFTTIGLYMVEAQMRFEGPNGEVSITPSAYGTSQVLEFLAYFDTSMAERLEIHRASPATGDLVYRALLPMKGLRTLRLTR